MRFVLVRVCAEVGARNSRERFTMRRAPTDPVQGFKILADQNK